MTPSSTDLSEVGGVEHAAGVVPHEQVSVQAERQVLGAAPPVAGAGLRGEALPQLAEHRVARQLVLPTLSGERRHLLPASSLLVVLLLLLCSYFAWFYDSRSMPLFLVFLLLCIGSKPV